MIHDPDVNDQLPGVVTDVLDAIDKALPEMAVADRDTFAFNVLVNALATVLERVRGDRPEQLAAYRTAAQALLED